MLISPSARRMFFGFGVSLLVILSLAGCGEKTDVTPTQNPSDVFTQVAQQVSVGLTQTSAAKPPATVAPALPIDMPAPAQGPTVAALATLGGQVVATLPAGAEQPTLQSLPPTAESSASSGTDTAKCKYRALLGYDSPKDETWIQEKKGFKRIWLLANVGDCPWPTGTYLKWMTGELFNATATEVITDAPIPVGERVRVETEMQAPDLPDGTGKATMVSNWMLGTPDGHLFGSGADGKGYFWINIVICEEKTCKEEE